VQDDVKSSFRGFYLVADLLASARISLVLRHFEHYLKSERRTVLNTRGALTPDTNIFLLYFSYCTKGLRSLR